MLVDPVAIIGRPATWGRPVTTRQFDDFYARRLTFSSFFSNYSFQEQPCSRGPWTTLVNEVDVEPWHNGLRPAINTCPMAYGYFYSLQGSLPEEE